MRLNLVDASPPVAAALRSAFAAHPEVRVSCGNILDVAEDTLVSPANSLLHLDGGIDEDYLEFFGRELQEQVYEIVTSVYDGSVPVGAAFLIATGNERIPRIIFAPTMEVPGAIEAPNAFFATSAWLKVVDRHPEIQQVFCPGFGTGVGRLDPDVAAREMEHAFSKWKARRRDESAQSS